MVEYKRAQFLFCKGIEPLIIPKEEVTVVQPDWSLKRTLLVLTRNCTNSVPVINASNQVDGVISKTDILDFIMHLNENEVDFTDLEKYEVRDAMDKNHSGIMADSIFSFGFEVLIHRSYIPIIDLKGRFVGILTRKVMMEKVIEYFQEEYLQSMTERKDPVNQP
jgi:CBS-domain-containing membrane protein